MFLPAQLWAAFPVFGEFRKKKRDDPSGGPAHRQRGANGVFEVKECGTCSENILCAEVFRGASPHMLSDAHAGDNLIFLIL